MEVWPYRIVAMTKRKYMEARGGVALPREETRDVGHDFVATNSFPGTRKLEH
jgi:hypothetical protein